MRKRITVSLDDADVATAERAVEAGQAASLSAWVAGAIRERAKHESLSEVLADIRTELGAASDEETAWARSVLGL
jgi:Arc/MetJ-type ribon-helix-helix transcriptional regulator